MDCEVIAIGTELLLGQVVDTNSAWVGQRLAEVGLACYSQAKVGDNHGRIVMAMRAALARSSAVVCCGGLGPTQDDITREALAEVMGTHLQRVEAIEQQLRERLASLSSAHSWPEINLKQADVPAGAHIIEPRVGTAPGLVCPVGDKVIYALPGVPAEMKEMFDRYVVGDLLERAGVTATIRSRFLRVWGLGESRVAELVAPRLEALEGSPTTIAFLANISEGVRVRVTTRAEGEGAEERALATLDAEERQLRSLLGPAVGGVDDEGLEVTVGKLLQAREWRLGVAESLTGGLVTARLTRVAGASKWLAGAVVSYGADIKRSLLGLSAGPVVSQQAAAQMAAGAARTLNADVGLSLTGVAGPDEQEGVQVGTVFVGTFLAGQADAAQLPLLRGDRRTVQERACTAALDHVRRCLTGLGA